MAETLTVSDAYRASRRTTSLLAGAGIAWAAAQFDVRELSIGGTSVDVSKALIPVGLLLGLVYSFVRCSLEFAMQREDVRRWELAQRDFKLTVFLVRVAVLALGLSPMSRSPWTFIFALVSVLLAAGLAFALTFVGMMIAMPIRVAIRARRGPGGAAASAIEAMAYGAFSTIFTLPLSVVAVWEIVRRHPQTFSYLTPVPSILVIALFGATMMLVGVSFLASDKAFDWLFAVPPRYVTIRDLDGREVMMSREHAAEYQAGLERAAAIIVDGDNDAR